MKKIVAILVCLVIVSACFIPFMSINTKADAPFSANVDLDLGGASDKQWPSVAVDNNGLTYVACTFYDGAERQIVITRVGSGPTWDRVDDDPAPSYAIGVDIAIDDSGYIYAVWSDSRTGDLDIYFSKSTDGGTSWSSSVKVNSGTTADQWEPAIWVDSTGNTIYVTWTSDDSVNYDVYFSKSTNGGTSFDTNVKMNTDATATDQQRPDVTAFGTNVYVVWDDARTAGVDIYCRKSSNSGTSFSTENRVNDNTGDGATFPAVDVGPTGRVYVTWYEARSSSWNVYTASSTDGVTFGTNVRVNSVLGSNFLVSPWALSMGVNQNDESIHVVWQDGRNVEGFGIYDIYYAKSSDLGVSFEANIRVNDDASGNEQEIPSLAVGIDGTVRVAWRDNRNTNWDIYYSQLSDTTAPPAPTGVGATPSTWTNVNSFQVDWTNPTDASGIKSGAWYKIGSPPTSNSDGTWQAPKPITVPSTEGERTIYIWLEDNAGNKDYLNYGTTTLRLDTTAPSAPTVVTATPSTWTNVNSFQVDWTNPTESGTSGIKTGAWYKIGSEPTSDSDGTWQGSKPITVSSTEGQEPIYIWLEDNAGNKNYTNNGSTQLYLDTSSPSTPTILSSTHPSETTWYSDDDPQFSWTLEGGPSPVTYYYELDNTPPTLTKTGTSHTETDVSDGEHIFYVYASDTGGTSLIDSYAVKIDITPPDSSVDSLGAIQTSTSFLVSWSGSDSDSQIKWYTIQSKDGAGGSWTDWASYVETTATSGTFPGEDGHTYYFQVRAQDNADNWESYPGGDGDTSTTIEPGGDLNPPIITNLQPQNGTTVTDDTPTISASYSDISGINTSSVILKVDGTDVTSSATVTSSQISYTQTTPLANGPHTVYLEVEDESTSQNKATETWYFTVNVGGPDTDPPSITNLQPSHNSIITDDTPIISASYNDATGIDTNSVILRVDDTDVTYLATITSSGITYTPTTPLANNVLHTVYLEVKDTSANHNRATRAWSFTVNITDSDSDGLPDDWEIGHFNNLNQDGDGDYDQDGYNNSQEYEMGTDPTDDTDPVPDEPDENILWNPLLWLGIVIIASMIIVAVLYLRKKKSPVKETPDKHMPEPEEQDLPEDEPLPPPPED